MSSYFSFTTDTLLQSLENATPSSALSSLFNTKFKINNNQCYYGNSTSSSSLEYFYGKDIPTPPNISQNGLFSYGHQTQMHSLSFFHKYPYIHPIAIIHSLLFIYLIDAQINFISIILFVVILFSIGESLKIERYDALLNNIDLIHLIAQFIGDILLIPYQCFINPTDKPLIQFQDTLPNRYIFCKSHSMLNFSPTFWCRNYIVQFMLVVWEEQFLPFNAFKMYRETLKTKDGGLVALDYWVDPLSKQEETETKEEYARFGDIYKSKLYYKYSSKTYGRYEFKDGDRTPILFIFGTFAGDSMAPPSRRIGRYFCLRGWRVIHYTKRGCGSPYYELLPLTNHKTFDLSGVNDAEMAVNVVTKRYPFAPKVCVGFSLGGTQVQDSLATFNLKHKHFVAGIKIDGTGYMPHLKEFNTRQNLICKVLGEVVHSSYIQSIFGTKNINDIDDEKVDMWQKQSECKHFNFKRIASVKSSEWDLMDVVRNIMAPAVHMDDDESYLHMIGPVDIERIDVPMLVLNSWNDGFQNAQDMPIGIANTNPNIFHCITKLGAHCIRREGLFFNRCWQSKVVFEFAQAVVTMNTEINL